MKNKVALLSMVLLLTVTSIFFAAGQAGAAETTPPPPDEQRTGDVEARAMKYLLDWRCDVSSARDGYINMSGQTEANQTVDVILLRLHLQRWNGSSWVEIGSWPFEKNNASYVSGNKSLQVAEGYYYRVKGTHGATKNGLSEQVNSYSESIYIN